MTPHTLILHERLIRLLKGCLTAWEEWLREEKVKLGFMKRPTTPKDSKTEPVNGG